MYTGVSLTRPQSSPSRLLFHYLRPLRRASPRDRVQMKETTGDESGGFLSTATTAFTLAKIFKFANYRFAR